MPNSDCLRISLLHNTKKVFTAFNHSQWSGICINVCHRVYCMTSVLICHILTHLWRLHTNMTFTMDCHYERQSGKYYIVVYYCTMIIITTTTTTINFINAWKNNFFSSVDVVKMLIIVRMLLLNTCVLSEQTEQFIFICLSGWIQLYIYEYICLFVFYIAAFL